MQYAALLILISPLNFHWDEACRVRASYILLFCLFQRHCSLKSFSCSLCPSPRALPFLFSLIYFQIKLANSFFKLYIFQMKCNEFCESFPDTHYRCILLNLSQWSMAFIRKEKPQICGCFINVSPYSLPLFPTVQYANTNKVFQFLNLNCDVWWMLPCWHTFTSCCDNWHKIWHEINIGHCIMWGHMWQLWDCNRLYKNFACTYITQMSAYCIALPSYSRYSCPKWRVSCRKILRIQAILFFFGHYFWFLNSHNFIYLNLWTLSL